MTDHRNITLANWETESTAPVIWFAYYDSRNFSFMSTGTSEAGAIQALERGLSAHAIDWDCAPNWWNVDGIETCSARLGETLRDNWPMNGGEN